MMEQDHHGQVSGAGNVEADSVDGVNEAGSGTPTALTADTFKTCISLVTATWF